MPTAETESSYGQAPSSPCLATPMPLDLFLLLSRGRARPQPPAHDVAQLLQVGGREVPVVAIASLHVLLNAVQVHRVQVQQFWL